jgi:hypothetical protein
MIAAGMVGTASAIPIVGSSLELIAQAVVKDVKFRITGEKSKTKLYGSPLADNFVFDTSEKFYDGYKKSQREAMGGDPITMRELYEIGIDIADSPTPIPVGNLSDTMEGLVELANSSDDGPTKDESVLKILGWSEHKIKERRDDEDN